MIYDSIVISGNLKKLSLYAVRSEHFDHKEIRENGAFVYESVDAILLIIQTIDWYDKNESKDFNYT